MTGSLALFELVLRGLTVIPPAVEAIARAVRVQNRPPTEAEWAALDAEVQGLEASIERKFEKLLGDDAPTATPTPFVIPVAGGADDDGPVEVDVPPAAPPPEDESDFEN